MADYTQSHNQPEEPDGPFREYANNVYFDPTVWDLNVTFGQLGIRLPDAEKPKMDWTTSVTLPWGPAKVAAYYFFANLMFHEHDHGQVYVPSNLAPHVPKAPEGASEHLAKGYAELAKLHARMFGPPQGEQE